MYGASYSLPSAVIVIVALVMTVPPASARSSEGYGVAAAPSTRQSATQTSAASCRMEGSVDKPAKPI